MFKRITNECTVRLWSDFDHDTLKTRVLHIRPSCLRSPLVVGGDREQILLSYKCVFFDFSRGVCTRKQTIARLVYCFFMCFSTKLRNNYNPFMIRGRKYIYRYDFYVGSYNFFNFQSISVWFSITPHHIYPPPDPRCICIVQNIYHIKMYCNLYVTMISAWFEKNLVGVML